MFTFQIPNTDLYVDIAMAFVLYALQEILRWSVDNAKTMALIGLVLSFLKIQAQKTESVTDDKIVTYLIQLFTFKWVAKLIEWITSFRSKKGPVKPPSAWPRLSGAGVIIGQGASIAPAVNTEEKKVENEGAVK